MKKWLSQHPNVSLYTILSLLLLCIVSFALYGMSQKQLQLTGAAKEQQFFALCRSHAEKGLIRLQESGSTPESAHEILSAAEYLSLCGEKGLEPAELLRRSGESILNGGAPDKTLLRLLKTIADGRIPYVPTTREEETQTANTLWNPHSLMRYEQLRMAEKCAGVSKVLREVQIPDNAEYSAYTCRNLYLILASRGYPLEYSIYLPYQGEFYSEEYCRQYALYWIRTNIPRDILGTSAEIESCDIREEGYYMTVRCHSGVMDIFVRNDNGKVGWFDGKMLKI